METKKRIRRRKEHDGSCTKCGKYFEDLNEGFYRHKNGKGGYFSACKECTKEMSKKYYDAKPKEEKKKNNIVTDKKLESKYEKLFQENIELKEYIIELEEAIQNYKETVKELRKEKLIVC